MIAVTMRPRRVAITALPLAVLAASQAGHLLAWQLRQGPDGLPALSSSAHGYVPALTTVVFGAGGAVVLAALCVVAVARVVRLGPVLRQGATAPPVHRTSVLDMAAALFVLQLGVYLAQETLEATWAGYPRPGVADLLLWGSLGQLPAAVAAGAALSWLSVRFEAAVEELAAAAPALLLAGRAVAPARLWLPQPQPLLRIQVAGRACSERGPPPSWSC